MQIVKRNKIDVVEFQKEKIVNAIVKSMGECEAGIDEDLAWDIAEEIENEFEDNDVLPTVECVQDRVEELLASNGRFDASKKYILFRNERTRLRDKKVNSTYRYLSDEFLSKYKHLKEPLNPLGSFVFYRTYSRFLPEEGRREFWWETVARAVDFNCSLSPKTTIKEAEQLFDNIFNLRQALSGRTTYTGGTQVSKQYKLSNFNCAYTTMDTIDSFADIFYLLLVGAGAGCGIQKKYTEKLPPFRSNIDVIHQAWDFTPKKDREDVTQLTVERDIATIIVGDSKEGFVETLRIYLNLLSSHSYRDIKYILFDYNYVRPKGERLKTFGGYASGHESLQNMIKGIDKIIKNRAKNTTTSKIKLKPIDVMDICNYIGENVVSGGVRRTSEIMFIDVDDIETQNAKNNLYIQNDLGEWVLDESIAQRQMSNNSIIYEEKPTREQLHEHIQKMRYSGEPGISVATNARKRNPNFKGQNPCFTGDMSLLTSDGFKTFAELDGKNVELVNINGEVINGKVWSNGVKETIKLTLSNKHTITCTPDHVFMDINENEVMAKDLKNIKIMPYIGNHKLFDEEYVKYGFMQGDGCLTRLKSDAHLGIEVNIGDKDDDIRFLFRNDDFTEKSHRAIYLNGYKEKMKELGFDDVVLPERKFPTTYDDWTNLQKSSFLQGCYSANGSIITNYRISYKTTSKEFAEKLVETLSDDFDITAYITTNKAKEVEFSNGTYLCKESYDVNIGRYKDIQTFHNEINFYHLYKKIALRNLLKHKAPYVMNVSENGMKEVYDFNEPKTHWGVVEGYIAHNCGEILLDKDQVCNLTTLNVMAFVKDGKLDKEGILKAQELSARAGYRMTCVDLELPNWDYTQKRDRLTGVSMTGFQEAMSALEYSKDEQRQFLSDMRNAAHKGMKDLARELGQNESLLVTTIKPEGSLSQVFGGVSSGLHFPHSKYYIRRIRINAFDPLCNVAEKLGWSVKPENGQTEENCTTKVIEFPIESPSNIFKKDVSAIEQLEIYKMFQEEYTDHNSSITVTIKNDEEWDEAEQWLWDNWDSVIGVSFLSLDDSYYQLMPYEEIAKEEYEILKSKTQPFKPSLLKEFEVEEESELDADDECNSGACSIR